MFKRRKKVQVEDEVVEISPETTEEKTHSEPVNIEEVAREVAEEITVYETHRKETPTVDPVVDSPTVRIPNLKELSEELLAAEAQKLLNDSADEENETEQEEEDVVIEELLSTAPNSDAIAPTSIDNTHEDSETPESPSERAEEGNPETNTSEPLEDLLANNAEEVAEKEETKEKNDKPKKANKLLRKKKKSSFRRKKDFQNRCSVFANIVMWAASLFLFVFCLSNLYQQVMNTEKAVGFFNVGNAVVVSESMVPTLEKNDFIVYKDTAIEKLRPQDIVVYKRPVADGYILIVHRLMSITDGYAITKGDNNAIQDEPFDADNIVGKVVLTVPQLGLVMESLSSLMGVITIFVMFCLFALTQFLYRKWAYNAWLKKLSTNKEEQKAIKMFLEM